MQSNHRTLYAESALLPEGWARDVVIDIDQHGVIAGVKAGSASQDAEILRGPVLPPLPNLHSHAFQRAMAGLAEMRGSGDDSFWTWRQEMYRTVGLLTPEDVEAIAAKLFVELMKGGFGAIAEFHYLHHGIDGRPYADRAEMARRILSAARRTGIGLTLLPVFYAHANFGGQKPQDGQRRFVHDVDAYLELLSDLASPCAEQGATLGCAIHSLRAATTDEMQAILAASTSTGPIHIHVAEQQREVEDCLSFSGRRPVDWLLDTMPVDERWCLVHATHMTAGETARLAGSGAVAGLCPATEANLGDGIFPCVDYLAAQGRFGIGTDSHVATSAAEELRLLEYSQRLRDQRRNRIAGAPGASTGRALFDLARRGGAQALGRSADGIAAGAPADLLVLDGDNPYLNTAKGDRILDRWIFSGLDRPVRDMMIGGTWRIRDGRHDSDGEIDQAFHGVLARLAAG
jgi:formimidoylglutamate deiminase